MTSSTLERPTSWAESGEREEVAGSPGERPSPQGHVNVGDGERKVSIGAGLGLALIGLRIGGLKGLGLIGAGYLTARRGWTGHCDLYEKLGHTSAHPAEPEEYFDKGIHVEVAYTVEKPRAELFEYWRDFTRLPTFMKHLESVSVLDDKRSHWVVNGPAGRRVEWDAEIINEEPDSLIAWRSLGGADVDNAGSVRFVDAPGNRGTEVRVVIDYIPPAGKVGKWVAMLFGKSPEITIKEDLRRFKRLMETGELPTIEGQPRGTCGCES